MVTSASGPAFVLDASAALAYVWNEPGAAAVERLLNVSAISTVNWSEVCQKAAARRVPRRLVESAFGKFALSYYPFSKADAEIAADLYPLRIHGLALADRCCLALARRLAIPVLTADRSWTKVDVGVKVELIR